MKAHGHSGSGDGRVNPSPTYSSWRAMRKRCLTASDKDFGRYGGAGISIHPRWHSFEQFLADMGERPPGTTLDRKDNSKGYSPDNCRWATSKQQATNRRATRLTPRNVAEIRRRAGGGAVQADLAYEFGVSRALVCMIVKGKRWKGAT